MSHEIRTPMTAILGYAELLLDPDVGPAGFRSHVETIRRNGEHLLSLVNDILDLSKIEAGKLKTERIPTDLLRVAEEACSIIAPRAGSKGIALHLQLDDALPAAMLGDPVRLRQVLVNLLGNAVKFTEAGSIALHGELDVGRTMLHLRVTDTGIGMSAEQVSRLYLPFSQADASTSRRFGGTGLGLRISRGLVESMGGAISVHSEPGRGTTFSVSLPWTPAADPAPEHEDLQRAALPRGATPLRGVTIALAEVGKDNQRLIAFHLRRAGAEVRIFSNGRETLESMTVDGTVAGELRVDPGVHLVLTDMQMPEMDGYTLARTLRAKGWRGPHRRRRADRAVRAMDAPVRGGERLRDRRVNSSMRVHLVSAISRESPRCSVPGSPA